MTPRSVVLVDLVATAITKAADRAVPAGTRTRQPGRRSIGWRGGAGGVDFGAEGSVVPAARAVAPLPMEVQRKAAPVVRVPRASVLAAWAVGAVPPSRTKPTATGGAGGGWRPR